jgi:hypothetical protein
VQAINFSVATWPQIIGCPCYCSLTLFATAASNGTDGLIHSTLGIYSGDTGGRNGVNITFLRSIFLGGSSSMKMDTTTAVRPSPCLQRCRRSVASNSVCVL